jgi:hypothetical protein
MALVLDGSAGVSGVDGTASNPSYEGTDSNTGIFFPAADTVAIGTGGTEALRVNSAQNVGVGYTLPRSVANYRTLAVGGTSNGGLLDMVNGSGAILGTWYSDSTGSLTINADPNGSFASSSIQFQVDGSERARITSGGDFLVGQTSANQTTVGFFAKANGEVSGCQAASTNGAGTQWNTYSTGAGAYRFYVGMGGTIFATSTTISAISDIRLKENIQDLDVGLDAVMALKPRKFDWKEGKGKNIKGDRGWIAQEFEQVFPDMISTWKDEPPEGEEPYKSVGADLIPVLVKAMQQQQAMIEEMKAEIAALKAQP